mmetsp:Transcript_16332/g.27624  ORF Transcript_16332/g.27624 Transcript_16332/m.27624 type:complete len:130 (+) Transcript_16332:1988-2377(+)
MARYGFSKYLPAHMYRVYTEQDFCSFDFGSKEQNLKNLGREDAFSFLDHYDKIDIPISYFISLDDHLCRPDDILIQYQALKKAHPSLASVKVFEGFNHIDFTYMNHHSMISEIMTTLKALNAEKEIKVY